MSNQLDNSLLYLVAKRNGLSSNDWIAQRLQAHGLTEIPDIQCGSVVKFLASNPIDSEQISTLPDEFKDYSDLGSNYCNLQKISKLPKFIQPDGFQYNYWYGG